MNSSGLQNLLGRAALLRRDLFGTDEDNHPQTFLYDSGGTPIPGYYTPIRYQRQLDELNLRATHEVVIRILKADLIAPALGKQLVFTQNSTAVTVKIDEIGNHPINPEWILGCNSLGR